MHTSRSRTGKIRHALVVSLSALALSFGAGCAVDEGGSQNTGSGTGEDGKHTGDGNISVFATTGYLGDAVMNIAPEADVTVMVQPGGDPHTYQPSTKDVEKMRDADLVFWNGLYLEAMMEDQLESLGDKQLAVGEFVDKSMLLDWPEQDHEGNDLYDPHIWNSPDIWLDVVDQVAEKIADFDPDNADAYKENAEAYKEKVEGLKDYAEEAIAKIPEDSRILITGHDAFQYYGATFGLEIHATDFVTSESQMSAQELDELASMIADNKVPTIFQDNLKNPQAIKSLKEAVQSKGWDVVVSDQELFADSLGDHSPVDTYVGVFEHNTDAILEGLTGNAE
ncbi:MAG: metal ABC transporter substrate-binding protein [Bowdeniella nasicola]|nr:metal ABC transporter substrate-binding protein [Bowdeniella nasicola]